MSFINVNHINKTFKVAKRRSGLKAALKSFFKREYQYIEAVKRMGIKLLPPDVNTGYGEFSVDGDSIRYGMSAVRSIGDGVVDAILEERSLNGKYKDLCKDKEVRHPANGGANYFRNGIQALIP